MHASLENGEWHKSGENLSNDQAFKMIFVACPRCRPNGPSWSSPLGFDLYRSNGTKPPPRRTNSVEVSR